MPEDRQSFLEWLRGRRVYCSCGEVLGIFRRRRFYSLVGVELADSAEARLRCPACGAEHRLRDLVKEWERRR